MRFRPTSPKKAGLSVLKLSGLVGLTAFGLATPVQAQQSGEDEVIVVTGSRIARDPNLVAPTPIQTVGQEQIQEGANFRVIDVLNDIPALSLSTTSETSLQDGNADGQNTLNLRGLGEERTLVLVNGRRHVSGVEGSQSVDIGSIPPALIERVEVLTGGASAVYGADAVTGVVNFILREDYEGFDLNVRGGLSGEGDADQYSVSALWGRNYGKANITVAVDYLKDGGLKQGEREFSANNRVSDDNPNPALRFQQGDIGASTPNFAQFYNFDNTGLYQFGLRIPGTAQDFIDDYTAEFGSAPTLTAAETALINRAANAPSRAILPFPTFSISSRNGVIAPADFGINQGVDTNANGVEDCLDSFVGYNSSLDGAASFGIAGGCWVVENGTVRPYRDGLVSGSFNQFGGDGIQNNFNEDPLVAEEEAITVNINGNVQATPWLKLFSEIKYSYQHVDSGGPLNTFYDLLFGAPDNPFLPAALQGVADATGGLYITRDPTDLGPNITTNERRTFRSVVGAEIDFWDIWKLELSGNYGQFNSRATDRNAVIQDRWFAAIDVIDGDPGPGVNPICRSDVDPTVPPTTIFGIPDFDPGFYSFTPGDGQCKPANIWSGNGGISQAAVNFITANDVTTEQITQAVFSALVTGDSSQFFKLPGGPIGIAFGTEYRRETSRIENGPLTLGEIPAGAPFPQGTLVSDVSGNGSLIFDPAIAVLDASGAYTVKDAFLEVSLPIFSEVPFAYSLEVTGAYRYSDYSTTGGAETYTGGITWAPIKDVKFRATTSQAVRAPNIFELFSPAQGTTFRPVDPCDVNEIDALADSDAATAAIRRANCSTALQALGLSAAQAANFTDPLSARFGGTTGGNPNLSEETADTITYGVVIQPRFLPGFSLTVDYYNIEVKDAIVAVGAQDIVDNCYDSASFPNSFCGLFSRGTNGGFNFLQQTQLNFGSIEAEGVDAAAAYRFALGQNDFNIRVSVSKQEKLDFFFDPADPTAVDPELGEIFRPEWGGNFFADWKRGPIRLGYHMQYIGEQLLRGAEIETFENTFGAAAMAEEVYLHDVNARFDISEKLYLFGGVQNVTDETPYATEFSYPTGPRGRYFFIGAQARF